ncbi:hypothetical protein ACN23B_03615 [Anabaena sp. FACHB-709]|uniref:Uncharacterized protein n=2 Tax=Nostocaceae TaxID=1162 RepID=A0A1Z4KRP5_ANAVA|nr:MULTISPECIES: hypothetical protein [Nostocaceae]BAY71700.1 hypothetical protein NIES23_45200 [Trichormus variabilis NIES-23]HBW31611.1 hypothetical protein [Nostoc sp. UBA8866]MBD2172546.1 hypothetical protein [Anabaena cylindrica FACHB-318]MBD2263989.1 hypothetical protein [Anabaena sp. FACHB-709]MBD2273483.1 hypothetical protein [Nostoc sp. PCC 7120 = FACHB-418]
MPTNYPTKIAILWIVFLLGTVFHTQLALMPLFHGLSVIESQKATNINEISGIMWLMLGFFALPMLAIVSTMFTDNKRYRLVHFGLTIIYSLLNFIHLVLDLLLPQIIWYQITLMVLLFLIGLLLNFVAFQWIKAPSRNNNYPEHLTIR